MKIRITGQDKGFFDDNLTAVLNIACLVAMGGSPVESIGFEWHKETENGVNRFNLSPKSNDWFANIKEEGPLHIVIQFDYRYSLLGKIEDALCHLLAVRFKRTVTIL